MKIKIIILFLCISSSAVFSQEDTIQAVNIFKYKIVDGKRPISKSIKEQETYTSKGQLVQKVFYVDTNTSVIEKIERYFYENNLLVSIEAISYDEEVIFVKRFHYSPQGNLVEKDIYKPVQDKFSLVKRIQNSYKDSKLKKQVIYINGEKAASTKFKYTNEKQIKSTTYKSGASEGNTKQKIVTSFYTDSLLTKKEIVLLTADNQRILNSRTYSYKEGKLQEEQWMNANNELEKRIVYEYDDKGRLSKKWTYDQADFMHEFLKYEYKRHKINLGHPEMIKLDEMPEH